MRKVLLDTNTFIGYLRGDERVLDWLAKAQCIYMSIFVLGKLYAGFKAGRREKENKQNEKIKSHFFDQRPRGLNGKAG